MHWTDVSGYQLPHRIAGHPALELCNTWAGWPEAVWTGSGDDPRREWLKDYDRFAVWAGHVDLLDADAVTRVRRQGTEHRAGAEQVLRRMRALRTALYRVFTTPSDDGAFALVAATAGTAMAASELVDEAGAGQRRARWRLPDAVGVRLPLLAVARSAADLLTSPERAAVRSCPAADCGWLFLDRRGRRRWCSMDSCGNRAKVRAHAARQRAGGRTGAGQ